MKWEHPFTSIIAGPTGCGKSWFVSNFLRNIDDMINTPIHEVIWCFAEYQPLYDVIKNELDRVIFHRGIVNLDDINTSDQKARLIIIDDMMREAGDEVVDMFTKGSHHRNLSVILISQNLFNQGKGRRDISLNVHYMILFKNPRDVAQIKYLARQVYPDFPDFIVEAYRDATSIPHGYLLFDFKQSTDDKYRIRSRVLPNERPCIVYLPDIKGASRKKSALV